MFGKKCEKCGNRIEKKFSYCPYCGVLSSEKEKEEKDYGFLGKQDIDFFENNEIKLPFGFNAILKKLAKEMNKQLPEFNNENAKGKKEKEFIKQGGISINISSQNGNPVIKVKGFGDLPSFGKIKQTNLKPIKMEKFNISEEEAKKIAKLPRQEAESKVRRLSKKIIYEIDLPDVKSIKDVAINQLENSIEIKAFSKDKAYFKFLPVSLPLLKRELENGKLVLELGEE